MKPTDQHELDEGAPTCVDEPLRLEGRRLAALTGEKRAVILEQFECLAEFLGIELMRRVHDEVLAIEEAGGVYLVVERRRRTPGGLFLALARELLSPEQRRIIEERFPISPRKRSKASRGRYYAALARKKAASRSLRRAAWSRGVCQTPARVASVRP